MRYAEYTTKCWGGGKIMWVGTLTCGPALVNSHVKSKVYYWQLIDIPRPISCYCFYKNICPSPNLYPNLPILHLYGVVP